MNTPTVVNEYLAAWNNRDPAAIVSTFVEGGTYADPVSGEVSGVAIGNYAAGLFAAFPDLSFEIAFHGLVDERTVAAQWIMRGTNTGSFKGMPPTGKPIVVPGADFIVVEGGRLRSVQGYFDSRAVPDQLGLQVIVQPRAVGPVTFGYGLAMQSGKLSKPGAISLTSLQVRSDQEAEEVRGYSRRMYGDIAKMPGFISLLTAGVGHRLYTATAWKNVEDTRQIHQSEAHRQAMDRFYSSDFSAGGMFSVWVPARPISLFVRCDVCKQMSDYEKTAGRCACGAEMPTPPPYW
jgi:steroid delta-isomerase-like uncharacterized protein